MFEMRIPVEHIGGSLLTVWEVEMLHGGALGHVYM
jgi:hypothetical protein